MYSAVTEGIRVEVRPAYLADQSDPLHDRYAFAYQVTIRNESEEAVQLVSRHWHIHEGDGAAREVEGPGVVGEQPLIPPGGSHRYTSGALLGSPLGSMRGTYTMVRSDGSSFEAVIPEFELAMPRTLH